MQVDDIIIGSGLTGLAVALGLPPKRRVVVLAGLPEAQTETYPGVATPASNLGRGGLGNYWHGVIPLAMKGSFAHVVPASFARLMSRFYEGVDCERWLRSQTLFVPWKPIRPLPHWQRLSNQRPHLTLINERAERVEPSPTGVGVVSAQRKLRAERVWIAAGALQTPVLLARSLGWASTGRTAHDHLIGYLGQVPNSPAALERVLPRRRDRHGVWLPCDYDGEGSTLLTLRPARFDFARLDHGIKMRSAFGLPTSRAAAAIAGRFSLGLVAEALYTKTGLLGAASLYSAYFQTRVAAGYALSEDGRIEGRNEDAFEAASKRTRRNHNLTHLIPSQMPSLMQAGIHLHGTLTPNELTTLRCNADLARLMIVDASAIEDIGPEHHSFKMMVAAFARAEASK